MDMDKSGTSDNKTIKCPFCKHDCLTVLLRKHLFRSHSKEINFQDINRILEKIIKGPEQNDKVTTTTRTSSTTFLDSKEKSRKSHSHSKGGRVVNKDLSKEAKAVECYITSKKASNQNTVRQSLTTK